MGFVPTAIATLATSSAIEDLRVLLETLQIFNVKPPTLYLFCDTDTIKAVKGLKYPGTVYTKDVLSVYTAYDRRQMEAMPGKHFATLWMDFMTEKINLLRWALAAEPGGVLFCDADICFTGPLPTIPDGAAVGLSPHMIVERDEKRYGKYNGGFAWFSATEYADVWWNACATARFYEQSALEDVARHVVEAGKDLYEFPKTSNYGWWRLWQGVKSSSDILKEWGINRMRAKESSGVCIEGAMLGSIHTHFHTTDFATKQFNSMFTSWLKILAPYHLPARKLLAAITKI